MLLNIRDITLRIDAQGRVRYARCNHTNKFVKHSLAQSVYDSECIPRGQAAVILSLAVLIANLISIFFLLS